MEFTITVLLIFPLLLPVVLTQATYHIRPTSESPCPYQDCLTLSEYAMETSRYTNSNNLTLLFLPGEHVLNTFIEFQFLDSLSLLGNQSSLPNVTSKIVCDISTGTPLFTLINITFVEIKALSISKCGDQNSSDGYQNNLHVLRDTFSNITVAKSVAPAITALFLTNFQLVNCHLNHNFLPVLLNKSRLCVRDSIFSDNEGSFGGAMTVYSSTVVFLGMNTFWRNEAVVGGGVFASGSSLVLVGSTRWINNTADYGGSISAVYTAITFEINNISISSNKIHRTTHSNDFLQNVAKHDGGGILLLNSILRHSQGVLNFTGNLAGNGGAISSYQSHISLKGFAMFERNSAAGLGGAVSVWNGTWSSAVISFVGNSAENGGAVHAVDSDFSFSISLQQGASVLTSTFKYTDYLISFVKNSAAENGGAIAVVRSVIAFIGIETLDDERILTMTFWGKLGFFGNKASENGGGILIYSSSVLNITASGIYVGNQAGCAGGMINAYQNSSVALSGDNTFTGNYAHCGGAVAITAHNDYCFPSYRLLRNGSIAFFSGKISLLNNTAEYEGGGLYLVQSSGQVVGNLTYVGNTAGNSGGGMYMYTSVLKNSGIEVCINNTASQLGGGSLVSLSTLTKSGTGIFVNNSAGQGGVISAENSLIAVIGEVFFANNEARFNGGGIQLETGSILKITGTGDYQGNGAWEGYGGMIFANYLCSLVLDGESSFTGNYAGSGGGIAIQSSIGLLLGKTSFINNQARYYGGGIYQGKWLSYSLPSLRISGNGTFIDNTAAGSGGVVIVWSGNCTIDGENMFFANLAYYGAVAAATDNANVSLFGTSKMSSNLATAGGVIYLQNSTLIITGNATFFNNTARTSGGVIFGSYSEIFLDGKSLMVNNCAEKHGGAIALKGCGLSINTKVVESFPWVKSKLSLEDNEANYSGGALYATGSHVELSGITSFVNNVAKVGGYGGGVHAVSTDILLKGLHDFINNSASYGGGIAVQSYINGGVLNISQNAFISFVNNRAEVHGGAVFVRDTADYTCPPGEGIPERICFINLGNPDGLPHVRLPYGRYRNISECIGHTVFEGNVANDGGHTLFGGALFDCRVEFRSEKACEYTVCMDQTCCMSGIEAIAALSHSSVGDLTSDPFNIMSDTYKVCVCDSKKPNCKQRTSNYSIYPGDTISIAVTVVGKQELIGTVANVIHALISESKGVWLKKGQDTQSINDPCSNLEYTVFSSDARSAKLTLSVEGPCQSSGLSYYVYISTLQCPFGFYSPFGSCICERRLQKYTNTCDINTRVMTRDKNFWVGFDCHSHGLILHPHCSFDYCKLGTVSFTLNSTDLQCAHGRSGVLCGACKSGYSLNLGSSRCTSCSNVFLLLFIPFAIAGFLLVVFLFVCKVTVAAGTTSGLIFYANVLAVNKSVFFSENETNILTVLVAWLNLDLGIQTCLSDGMDMYTRTWLQFVFPLYIWLLVGIIALVSRHSTFIARIIGPTNPVSVLATLFLLSYTKLLRTIVATLSFTTLDYPDDKSATVWVYDGNIEYFKGKHIPLFLAGLLAFLLLFLPYTLVLLFGQWIKAGSSHKLLTWINKPTVKYFLDAYHAPYKNQHHYWTGLLLLIRFVLFIISAVIDINSPRDPSVNLLALGVICAGMKVWIWNTGNMYKKWYGNILESSFILNLTVLALSTMYVKLDGGNPAAIVYTSVSVAFLTSIGIITYHAVELLRESRVWRITIFPKLQSLKQTVTHHKEQHDAIEMTTPPTAPPQPVPTTFVELREPLLESQH